VLSFVSITQASPALCVSWNPTMTRLKLKSRDRISPVCFITVRVRVRYSNCAGVCWHYCLHAGKRAAVIITVSVVVITSAYQLSSAEEQNHNQKLQRWRHLFHRRSVNLGRGQGLKMNERCLISSVTARSLLIKPTLSHLHGTKFRVVWKPPSQPAMLISVACIEDCKTRCLVLLWIRLWFFSISVYLLTELKAVRG
jgi:hypothetical protein